MTRIGDFELTTDFTTSGGGQCRWAFARKGVKEYFLKEFLHPTYPVAGAPGSPATAARKLARCQEFEAHHRSMMQSLEGLSKTGGNLIVAREFFRHGARYYKVTDKVDVSTVSIEKLHHLELKQRFVLAGTVAHSLQILHRLDLVHGDLKPANVLIKETGKGYYAAKLIDFDDAYMSRRPEAAADLVGDIVYYSPETHLYVQGEGSGENLTSAADIFSLGMLFCEYFTGSRPQFGASATCAVGALNGVACSTGLEGTAPAMHTLIREMLHLDFAQRPNIASVIATLKTLMRGGPPAGSERKPTGTRLRGKGLGVGTTMGPTSGGDASRLRGSLISSHESPAGSTPIEDGSAPSRLSGSLASRSGSEEEPPLGGSS